MLGKTGLNSSVQTKIVQQNLGKTGVAKKQITLDSLVLYQVSTLHIRPFRGSTVYLHFM